MVVLVVVRSTNQKSSNLNSFIFLSTGLGKLGLGLGWAWLGYQYSTVQYSRLGPVRRRRAAVRYPIISVSKVSKTSIIVRIMQ